MHILKQIKLSILAALIIAGGMIGGAVAFAQDASSTASAHVTGSITFPITELGGCTDKASCKTYCDETAHMTECVQFAQSHGLMNKEEGDRAKQFASSVKAGEGPGGCTSPGMCKTYCDDVAHVDECVAFAEKHDFKGHSYEHGKKIGLFLKAGGKMPGGCTSRASCQEYCSNLSHAQECFTFAAHSGIASSSPQSEGSGERGEGSLQKLEALAKAGETPGGCKTKDECMQYCRGDGHRDECVQFAEKAGLLNKDESEHAKNFHGGPGGCDSQESCHAFCNDPANHDECFRFAEANGLMSTAEIKQTKDGWLRMREGLSGAPKGVADCLGATLGTSTIEAIESGKFVPGSGTGDKARTCFEKFGGHNDPKKAFSDAPPQVTACLKEKLGADLEKIQSGAMHPTPEMADSFRMCFQQMEMNRDGAGVGGKQGSMPDTEKMKTYLRSAPPEVSACLKEKLGDKFDKLLSGEVTPTPELGQTMSMCFRQFHPKNNQEGQQSGVGEKMPSSVSPMQGGGMMNRLPPQVAACLKEKLGAEKFAQLGSTRPTPEIEQLIKSCFEQFGGIKTMPPEGATSGSMRAPINTDVLSHFSPEIQACLKEKLGVERLAQLGQGGSTAELKEVITACFAQFGKPMTTAPLAPQGSTGVNWLNHLPPQVQMCVKAKVGEEVFAKLGEMSPTPLLEQTVKGCFTQSASPVMGGGPTMPPPLGSDALKAIPPTPGEDQLPLDMQAPSQPVPPSLPTM